MLTKQPKTYHCAYLYLLTGCHASVFQVLGLGCDRKLGMMIPGRDRDRNLGIAIVRWGS